MCALASAPSVSLLLSLEASSPELESRCDREATLQLQSLQVCQHGCYENPFEARLGETR